MWKMLHCFIVVCQQRDHRSWNNYEQSRNKNRSTSIYRKGKLAYVGSLAFLEQIWVKFGDSKILPQICPQICCATKFAPKFWDEFDPKIPPTTSGAFSFANLGTTSSPKLVSHIVLLSPYHDIVTITWCCHIIMTKSFLGFSWFIVLLSVTLQPCRILIGLSEKNNMDSFFSWAFLIYSVALSYPPTLQNTYWPEWKKQHG